VEEDAQLHTIDRARRPLEWRGGRAHTAVFREVNERIETLAETRKIAESTDPRGR
jgi:hypothetical protein